MAAVMFRTAQGWEWKWAVVVGWLMWWSLAFVHGINFFGMSLGIHITYFFVLIAIGIYLELYFLTYLRSYDENKKKKKDIRKSSRSPFFIELRPFLRGKRLRMVFVLPVIFLAQAFWYAAIGYEDPDAVDSNMFLPLAIMVMPLMALQLTFALEGNYFDGVWTRPINIEKLLLRKYYTALPMAVLSFLILLISHFLYDTSIILMVGSLLFTIGFSNLLMLTFCFHTKAMDIFASGFMNTQGNDYSISSFATTLSLMLITMALIGVLPPNTCGIIFGVLGIMGFAVHKYAISWIAHRYEAKRYKHFERYRNK
jgi:putative membrane protein